MAIEVTDRASFEREVLAASHERPIVVDFWAPWCAPCRVLGPVLEQLEQRDGGRWTLAKIDVQAHPDLAEPFGVTGIPAVFALREGKVVDQFVGNQPPAKVSAWIEGVAPNAILRALREGQQAALRGDKAAAVAAFEQVLQSEPEHPLALISLAEIDVARAPALLDRLPERLPADLEGRRQIARATSAAAGADEEALRARISADPRDLAARHALAFLRLAAGDRASACEELLEIVRRDRNYQGGAATREFLALLDAAGPGWDKARDLRQRYAMELFR